MLEIIIKKYLENYENSTEVVDNEEIQPLENECAELLEKLKKLDKKLGNQTDDLVGNMIVTNRDLFFEKGFKCGLILAQEIHQLLLNEDSILNDIR